MAPLAHSATRLLLAPLSFRVIQISGTHGRYVHKCEGVWASSVAQTVKNLLLMQETRAQSLGQDDPLEKGMAIHFSILSWRIPWTKEYGGLQFMGLQGFGHN